MDYMQPSARVPSAASGRFLGARPAEHSMGDYFAKDLGSDLANIGLAVAMPRQASASDLFNKQKIEEAQRKQAALDEIAKILPMVDEANGNDLYFQALPIAAHGGISTQELNEMFRGAAASRGAGDMVLGRMGDRGAIGKDTTFSPEVAHGMRVSERGQADYKTMMGLVEKGMVQGNERYNKGMDFIRDEAKADAALGRAKDLEKYKVDLKPKDEKPPKANVTLPQLDDVRKNVVMMLSDKLGTLPTKEGDFASAVKVDPGLINSVVLRAAQLMEGENAMPPQQAIGVAVDELTATDAKGVQDPGSDLGMLGIWGKKEGPMVTKKPKKDPLGLFGGK